MQVKVKLLANMQKIPTLPEIFSCVYEINFYIIGLFEHVNNFLFKKSGEMN